jgi:hypothetical protein
MARQPPGADDPLFTARLTAWLMRQQSLTARFEGLATAANDCWTEAQADEVAAGVALLGKYRDAGYARGDWPGSTWTWCDGFFEQGRSALPPGLSPALVAQLLFFRVTERRRWDQLDVVCLGCGLQLPRANGAPYYPEPVSGVFPECPHCGGTAFQWCIEIPQEHHPWMDDPSNYIGPRPHPLDRNSSQFQLRQPGTLGDTGQA